MLAVDGQQQPSTALVRLEGELSGGDEALLVRQGEIDAALERPERGGEPREPDHCVEHEVRLCALEQLSQIPAHLSQGCQPVDRLGTGRGRAKLEFGVGLDDLERLAADRSSGAEQRNSLHPGSVGSWD